jgi:hypothetical protein
MRWSVVVLLAACVGTAPQVPVAHPPSVLGNIEASTDLDGAVIGASDARATIVVVFASWCERCKIELAVIDGLRAAHPRTRMLGINVKAHEEYAARGSSSAVRAYVAAHAPWLRVVPADDALFTALGRPPKVPTIYVFDAAGTLAARFDRRDRTLPDAHELDALLARLGG